MHTKVGRLGGVVVSVSDSGSRGPGFDSRSVHCHATTLGKLLSPIVPLSPSSTIWYRPKGGDALQPGR